MRIRTIRPEFWESPQVGSLCTSARLTFIGLWNLADREGRLKDRPEHIAIKLFPYDRLKPARLDAWLGELTRAGLIVRYRHGGERYIAIPTWRRHQRPHPHEAPSEIPPPASDEEPLAQNERAGAPSAFTPHAAYAEPVPAREFPAEPNPAKTRRTAPTRRRAEVSPPSDTPDSGLTECRFKPPLCRISLASDHSPAAAVTFHGLARHRDPSPVLIHSRSSNFILDPPAIDPDPVETPSRDAIAAPSAIAHGRVAGDDLGRDAPAAPAKEQEWEEQDAWLIRFLRHEQKAFVGAHLEPLLADYAFWCRLSEVSGGLSREFLEVEFAKMALWLADHPARGPAASGVKRFVARWVERAADQPRRRMPLANQTS
jgi:hypothetical protein